jgi:hypothetical protein
MLLSSKKCGGHSGGCKGPVTFSVEGKALALCRHSMGFRALSPSDIPVIWKLLEAESRCEAKTE